MKREKLKNNYELYSYLCSLAELLNQRGKGEFSEKLVFASKFFGGSSSEFLYETKDALNELQKAQDIFLSEQEKLDLKKIISQIDDAFNKIGGG